MPCCTYLRAWLLKECLVIKLVLRSTIEIKGRSRSFVFLLFLFYTLFEKNRAASLLCLQISSEPSQTLPRRCCRGGTS
jgi:hypothetical protein